MPDILCTHQRLYYNDDDKDDEANAMMVTYLICCSGKLRIEQNQPIQICLPSTSSFLLFFFQFLLKMKYN